jgi:hypothetical protein
MKSRSSAPHDSSRLPIAWNSAWSPPSLICTNSSASGVPLPTRPRTFCGFLNRISPASGSGLTAMIFAPLPLASSSAVSIRGWLVPGFWPDDHDQVGPVVVAAPQTAARPP